MPSIKLSKTAIIVLGVVLAAIEAIQLNVAMTLQVHAVITMAIMVMSGAGIAAASAKSFLAILPPHFAVFVSSALGGLIVLVGTVSLGTFWHTVVAVVVVVATTLGVGPTNAPAAAPPTNAPAAAPVV